ncbi:thiamine monophosphate synthase [Pedobacter sp. Leaf41]|uniref:thiamine phosphate synthase n=1 Tax=Pedobacter sp. Leaf41 TaxID=1736218 RepID=UPI0007027192|nr:thiamine phosphate synthase [Pedobacter sp. Leaf41]KQN34964.1 thiamine monophosphate synthase [Pedobacter sp. Leaf41]
MEIVNTIEGGVYLVVDPALERETLLKSIKSALAGGINIVQIWNNWPAQVDKLSLIRDIARLCAPYSIPILINEDWKLLLETDYLAGVHFDQLTDDLLDIRQAVGRKIIIGVTCSGHLDTVHSANQYNLDYISFCAMFPSSSAGSCNIVLPETVQQAKAITNIPLFISGGMTPENTAMLKLKIPFDGVAVISGILVASNPEKEAKAFQLALNNQKK